MGKTRDTAMADKQTRQRIDDASGQSRKQKDPNHTTRKVKSGRVAKTAKDRPVHGKNARSVRGQNPSVSKEADTTGGLGRVITGGGWYDESPKSRKLQARPIPDNETPMPPGPLPYPALWVQGSSGGAQGRGRGRGRGSRRR